MSSGETQGQIVQLLIAEAPAVVDFVRGLLRRSNPEAPTPSSEDVIAALEQAYTDSSARDEMLRAALQAEIDTPPTNPPA